MTLLPAVSLTHLQPALEKVTGRNSISIVACHGTVKITLLHVSDESHCILKMFWLNLALQKLMTQKSRKSRCTFYSKCVSNLRREIEEYHVTLVPTTVVVQKMVLLVTFDLKPHGNEILVLWKYFTVSWHLQYFSAWALLLPEHTPLYRFKWMGL